MSWEKNMKKVVFKDEMISGVAEVAMEEAERPFEDCGHPDKGWY